MIHSCAHKIGNTHTLTLVALTDLLQISELAIFGECIGVVLWAPAALAVLLLLSRYALAPLWRRRPIWLRNFAAEEPSEAEPVPIDHARLPKAWASSTVALLVTSLVGLVLSALASLQPTTGPLFLLPLVPHVSGNRQPCPIACCTCPRPWR